MRATLLWVCAGSLLFAGCGQPPPVEPTVEPTAEPAPEPAVAAAPPPSSERSALEPVPRPDLGPLKPTMQHQVEQELAELDAMLDDPGSPPAKLAERFGLLGRVYHAYGLFEPAAVAYRNAARLAARDPRWPYLLAVVAHKRGEPAAAEEHLSRARDLAPDDVPTLIRLAELRLTGRQIEAAESLFRRALEVDSGSAAAIHGLARVATARGDHAAAVEHLKRVLELQPGADSVHYLLGQAYRRLGDRAAAERHIAQRGPAQVAFDDPLVEGLQELLQGVGIHLARGLEAFGAARWEEAIAEYRAVLELEPENPTALRTLGLCLASAGRHAEAIREFERMLELYPDHQLARLEYASVLLQRGLLEQAIDNFRIVLRADPDFKTAHFNLATAYSRLDRWQEAAAGFREVLRIDRDDVEGRYYLAVALDQLGRLQEAETELRLALQRQPDHLLARQRLGSLLERNGDPEGALQQFRAVLELEAPDEEKALAHYQIGRLLGLAGDDLEALDHFRRSVDLFPQFWQARFAVGNSLARLGRHREAVEIFAKLAAADPSNVLARQREAESLMGDGQFAEAHRRLEEGLTAHPRSLELATVLVRLLATADDAEVRDGRRALELAERLFAARKSVDQGELVAMALAELQRFEEAAAWQRRLLTWAESEGEADALPRLRRNLARYESRQPVRQGQG